DGRGSELVEAVSPAQGEQFLAALNVRFVTQARVAWLQFQFRRVWRRHHGLGVDGHSVLNKPGGIFHDICLSCGPRIERTGPSRVPFLFYRLPGEKQRDLQKGQMIESEAAWPPL